MNQAEIVSYYSSHGPMTDPRQHAHLFSDLPEEVPALVKTIQGLQVHIFWAKAYHLELDAARESEVTIRPVWRKLPRLLELDPAPLIQPRPSEKKLVGNCRDFTVFTVSMLRSKGIPARSRCGFGTYFNPGKFEDHWVLEYWDEQRWVMVDAQLDELQQRALNLRFDPLDMPPGAFVTGGEAWLMARRGEADPDCFGIFEYKGMDFIKGNLLRDLAAFNKFEVLPWDFWGWLERPAAEMPEADLALLDQAAQICAQADVTAALALYAQSPQFIAPLEWAD
jgi:hypothetical protein